ncbi:MAG: hypothetical protein SH850_12775 [Planctomycetaceae bacterium]|nr:hypothetical protein [Planctomycetaceae bacterium]
MPQFDEQAKRKFIWVCAVLAPLAAVQAARFLGGSGLAAAPAATSSIAPTEDPATPAPAAARPLTHDQKRAIEFLRTFRVSDDFTSPMDSPEPVPTVEPEQTAVYDAPVKPTALSHSDALANVRVSAIVGRDAAAVAMIDHRLCRVGDEVAPGWRVQAIDARRRSVTLVHADGKVAALTPPILRD